MHFRDRNGGKENSSLSADASEVRDVVWWDVGERAGCFEVSV